MRLAIQLGEFREHSEIAGRVRRHLAIRDRLEPGADALLATAADDEIGVCRCCPLLQEPVRVLLEDCVAVPADEPATLCPGDFLH